MYHNIYVNSSMRYPALVDSYTGDVSLGAIATANGAIYCSFTRGAEISYDAPDTGDAWVNDLSAEAYNPMSSSGITNDAGEPTRHTVAGVGAEPIDFNA